MSFVPHFGSILSDGNEITWKQILCCHAIPSRKLYTNVINKTIESRSSLWIRIISKKSEAYLFTITMIKIMLSHKFHAKCAHIQSTARKVIHSFWIKLKHISMAAYRKCRLLSSSLFILIRNIDINCVLICCHNLLSLMIKLGCRTCLNDCNYAFWSR